jgi:hypothetical protein
MKEYLLLGIVFYTFQIIVACLNMAQAAYLGQRIRVVSALNVAIFLPLLVWASALLGQL